MGKKKLPKKLYQYFWDVDPGKINLENRDYYVTERLLEWGDVEAIRWLNKSVPLELIRLVVKNSRQLSCKSANYWAGIFNINKQEVRCLNPAFQRKHRKIWLN